MQKDYTINLDGVDVILKIDLSVKIDTVYYKNGGQPFALIALRDRTMGKRNALSYADINLFYVSSH